MKSRLSIIAAALVVSATTASGAVKEGQFSISPVIGGYTFAEKQHIETNAVYGIRGGYNITKNIGVDALFDYLNSKDKNSKSDVGMYRFGGELLYNFMPDNKFVPYVAAGVAGLKFNATGISRPARLAFDYGVGVKYFVTDTLALRGDVRHLVYQDNTTPTYSNVEYTLGVLIPFGGVQPVVKPVEVVAQPKAAPVEAKVVAAPPAPVVAPPPPKVEEPKPAPAPVVQSAQKASAAQQRFCNKPAVLAVEFDTNKADIKPKYKTDLDKLGEFLKEFPTSKGEISGHTDNVGGKAFNDKLSQRRADSVKQYMEKNFSVAPGWLTAKGFGFSKPVASNKTKQGKARNRRIETNFTCE